VRKSVLRLIGGFCGGLLALFVIISVAPNTTGPFFFILAAALVTGFADYGGRANPQVAYAFLQTGITYMICVVALRPSGDVDEPLNRFVGIMIGIAATFLCFRFLSRDYAGTQALAALESMLRPLTKLIPQKGKRVASRDEVVALERGRGVATADVLRLVDEAAFEGRESGIDSNAALTVLAITRRVAIHAGALGYSLAEAPTRKLPRDLSTALDTLHGTIALWIDASADVIETAVKLTRPDARLHRKGREAIRRSASRQLPRLEPLLEDVRVIHAARTAELIRWPMRELDAVAAELVHVKRLAEALPSLHAAVLQTCVPEERVAKSPAMAPAQA